MKRLHKNYQKQKIEELSQIKNVIEDFNREFSHVVMKEEPSEKPDFIFDIDGKLIGLEVTASCPSKKNGKKFDNTTIAESLDSKCYQYQKNNPYYLEKTKDQSLRILIYATSRLRNKKTTYEQFEKELTVHLLYRLELNKQITTPLIRKIKIAEIDQPDGICNNVAINYISARLPVRASDIWNEIEKKAKKSIYYNDSLDSMWLCIYLPWQENKYPNEIDYSDIEKEEFEKKLQEISFERIYLTSVRSTDFKRIK